MSNIFKIYIIISQKNKKSIKMMFFELINSKKNGGNK